MPINVTLLFFVLMVFVAGFIAWAGDRIGHKSGKKRHSLFGLRPRHTAMVFTIGSGMAISLVSFGLFYASSEAFRIVVRDGAALYDTNRRLKADNRLTEYALKRSRQRATEARQESDRLLAERDAAEAARDRAVDRLQDVQAKVSGLQTRYDNAAADLTQTRSNLETASGELHTIQANLNEKTRQIATADTAVREAQSRVTIAQRNVRQAKQRQQTAENDAKNAQSRLANVENTANKVFDVQAKNLQKQNQTLTKQQQRLVAQGKELDDLQTRLAQQTSLYVAQKKKADEQKQVLEGLATELTEKRAEYDRVVSSTAALRRRQITYRNGEEVDRFPIKPGYNVWRIQAILDAALTQAAHKAEQRGAARSGQARAVLILPRLARAASEPVTVARFTGEETSYRAGESAEHFTEDDQIRAAADAIRRENRDVVVLVKAVANSFAGEPVAVDFVIHPNPVVLSEKTPIAETLVRPGSRQEVADLLQTFLASDVHKSLIDAGIIPVARGGEASDVEAASSELRTDDFALTSDEWLNLLEAVRNAGPRVRVRVFPARDLRAGDTAALRFEVKSAP